MEFGVGGKGDTATEKSKRKVQNAKCKTYTALADCRGEDEEMRSLWNEESRMGRLMMRIANYGSRGEVNHRSSRRFAHHWFWICPLPTAHCQLPTGGGERLGVGP